MLSAYGIAGRLWMGLAIITAMFCFTKWGYFWYAVLLDDYWQALIGRTEAELFALAIERGGIQTVMSYVISAVQAVGLLLVLRMTRARSFLTYQAVAAILSLLIVLPALGNEVLFAGSPTLLWALDFTHFILGYGGMATVFYIFKHLGQRFNGNAAPKGTPSPVGP